MDVTTNEKRLDQSVSQDFVLRSLRRSRVRTEIVMYLHKIYPEASSPAEISRNVRIDATNVLGALRGMGKRFVASNSLLGMWLVGKIERDGETYYRLSERGKSFIESIEPPVIFYDWKHRYENEKKKTGGKKQK